MAIILVDIQVLSLDEINERSEKCKRDIEVRLVKQLICFKPLTKEATYNEKLPELSRKLTEEGTNLNLMKLELESAWEQYKQSR